MARQAASLRVLVVVKRTAYRHYVKDAKNPHVLELLSRRDPIVARMLSSHQEHESSVDAVARALDDLGAKVTWVRRAHATFDATGYALVLTVGGDGTLLAASHNVGSVPILGVNSDPTGSVGFFCGTTRERVRPALEKALNGKLGAIELTRMTVLLNGRSVAERVLNDALFCHQSPAATSRYFLELRGHAEEHKSSGFWIGPAAGSTAAQLSAGGRVLPLTSTKLQLVVREPYTPAGERYRFVRTLVRPHDELLVRSKMRDAVLFLDGPHAPHDIRLGDMLTFRRSAESLRILGMSPRKH